MSPQTRLTLLLLGAALAVYLLPLVARVTPEDWAFTILLLSLFLVNPLLNLGLGTFYGWRFGTKILFPAASAGLFVPAAYIVYNESAVIYGVTYLVIGFVGLSIGAFARTRRERPL